MYTHIKLNGNTKHIDKTGEMMIKSAFGKEQSTTMSIDNVPDNRQPNVYIEFIKSLQEQLRIKDKQINELTAVVAKQADNRMRKKTSWSNKWSKTRGTSIPVKRLLNEMQGRHKDYPKYTERCK
jgi:hypothetical protein